MPPSIKDIRGWDLRALLTIVACKLLLDSVGITFANT